jgi:hypothetical protein
LLEAPGSFRRMFPHRLAATCHQPKDTDRPPRIRFRIRKEDAFIVSTCTHD